MQRNVLKCVFIRHNSHKNGDCVKFFDVNADIKFDIVCIRLRYFYEIEKGKNKMTKKKLVYLLSGLMSISLLSACGDSKKEGTADSLQNVDHVEAENNEATDEEFEMEEAATLAPVFVSQSGRWMYQGVFYEIDSEKKEAIIVDYYGGELTEISIPEDIVCDGATYPVTVIGEDAFNGFLGLESVTIGKNVRTLEYGAFARCYDLAEVIFTGNTEELGEQSFVDCSALEEIELPTGMKTIGKECFSGCQELSSVVLPEGLQAISEYAFNDCENLKKIEIPSSVTELEVGIFNNCTDLKKVTLNEGLLAIGEEVFEGCSDLKDLTIPASVESIGEEAFYLTALQSVTFLGNPEILGENIFEFCDNLKTIYASSDVIEVLKTILEDYEVDYIVNNK